MMKDIEQQIYYQNVQLMNLKKQIDVLIINNKKIISNLKVDKKNK